MLSPAAWSILQHRYDPHDFDLCALDSNAQRDREGHVLPHFTPGPTPASSGVNIFAQGVSKERNLYVFPPMVFLGPVLRFLLQSTHINVTMIVFDVHPRRYWWPLLRSRSVDSFVLGKKGDSSVLLFPSSIGFSPRLCSATFSRFVAPGSTRRRLRVCMQYGGFMGLFWFVFFPGCSGLEAGFILPCLRSHQ